MQSSVAASRAAAGAFAAGVGDHRPWVVIYDGNCQVCDRIVRRLNAWDRDGALEIIPSQQPGVAGRFPWLAPRDFAESVQLVGPGGETHQGAAAVERILDLLPRGAMVTWLFSVPLVRPLAERLYRWFARSRYHLGCGKHCTQGLVR